MVPTERRWVLWGLGAAVALLALQVMGSAADWRFDRTRFDQGAWYLVFSAQFVHFGWRHAMANAVALGGIMAWGAWRQELRALVCVFVGALLAVGGRLAWDVDCHYYAGASGWLHGVWAGCLLWTQRPLGQDGAGQGSRSLAFEQRFARLLLPALLLKLWLESVGRWPTGWRFPVYTPAHWAGVVGGILAACAAWWGAQKR